ncbi:MAG: restriction endonuclease subunit S, partial [Bacteroidota bacterium]
MKTKKKIAKGSSTQRWAIRRLGDIAEIKKGKQLNKAKFSSVKKFPVWNGGTSPSGYTNHWNNLSDVITISEGGESCGFVNFCKEKFWCGAHCYTINLICKNTSKSFLFQLLKFNEKRIMKLRIGSGLPNIQKTHLKKLALVTSRNFSEQTAIAQVLSDVDTLL